MLAGISPTYLAFLEQGRDVNPSRQVLDALARALGLDAAEREYVHTLVRGEAVLRRGARDARPRGPRARRSPRPVPDLRHRPPLGRARRQPRGASCCGPTGRPSPSPTSCCGCSPRPRRARCSWSGRPRPPRSSRATAPPRPATWTRRASSRSTSACRPASEEVRRLWPRHAVAPLGSGSKLLRHPSLGVLRLHHTVLQVADEPEHKLVTFRPEPGDAERIAALL